MSSRSKTLPLTEFGEYIESSAQKSRNTLVAEIDDLTRELYKLREDPESVSKILLELAAKNTGLGNYLIEALDEERTQETTYKWTVDKVKIELMAASDPNSKSGANYTATAAESQAKLQSHKMLQELNFARKNVDILKIKRNDTDKVLDIGRSRLSLIKGDLKNA